MLMAILFLALAAAFCFLATLRLCHMFQLEGYKAPGYMRWLGEHGLKGYGMGAGLRRAVYRRVYGGVQRAGMAPVCHICRGISGFRLLRGKICPQYHRKGCEKAPGVYGPGKTPPGNRSGSAGALCRRLLFLREDDWGDFRAAGALPYPAG